MHHYLFECQSWTYERWLMGKELSWEAKSARHILNNNRGTEALMRYIGRTRRFAAVYGDVSLPTL